MSIAEFVLVSGDFMGEWVKTPKCWNWRSFTKMTIPVAVCRNSSYDELVARVIWLSDNFEDKLVERSFEGPVNSSEPPPPPPCPAVDDDFNDYENDGDDPINTENDCMHMEDVSSDSQDDDEDHGMGSQPVYFFTDGTNFYISTRERDMWKGRCGYCIQALQGILPVILKHIQEVECGLITGEVKTLAF
ncbi:hypothetical protein FXO38_35083 [Capsicum annuum]|nr:hypothetical protein FXO38_35083 [Capsicum annuum]